MANPKDEWTAVEGPEPHTGRAVARREVRVEARTEGEVLAEVNRLMRGSYHQERTAVVDVAGRRVLFATGYFVLERVPRGPRSRLRPAVAALQARLDGPDRVRAAAADQGQQLRPVAAGGRGEITPVGTPSDGVPRHIDDPGPAAPPPSPSRPAIDRDQISTLLWRDLWDASVYYTAATAAMMVGGSFTVIGDDQIPAGLVAIPFVGLAVLAFLYQCRSATEYVEDRRRRGGHRSALALILGLPLIGTAITGMVTALVAFTLGLAVAIVAFAVGLGAQVALALRLWDYRRVDNAVRFRVVESPSVVLAHRKRVGSTLFVIACTVFAVKAFDRADPATAVGVTAVALAYAARCWAQRLERRAQRFAA